MFHKAGTRFTALKNIIPSRKNVVRVLYFTSKNYDLRREIFLLDRTSSVRGPEES